MKKLVAVILVGILICVGYATFLIWSHCMARTQLIGLLEGSAEVSISKIEFRGQGKRAVCSEQKALLYLNSQFQNDRSYSATGGIIYEARLTFKPSGSVCVMISIPDDLDGITFDVPELDPLSDPTYYFVQLKPPMPEKLKDLLTFLISQSDKGTSYMLTDGEDHLQTFQ